MTKQHLKKKQRANPQLLESPTSFISSNISVKRRNITILGAPLTFRSIITRHRIASHRMVKFFTFLSVLIRPPYNQKRDVTASKIMADAKKKLCELCGVRKQAIKRPKNLQKICKECFYHVFETEIHQTIVANKLFYPGEKVAIGASGGKDSTVLAYVLKLLNERYNYQLELVLLSIDEGIVGYRDDSLATVKRNQVQYDLPLEIVSYRDLYNWTMDEIVACAGVRSSCTYCGVLRRQALDRGAAKLGIKHVVTGHNADDMAETVLMNILRGDFARLEKSTVICTQSSGSPIKRSKPFKYIYQKEIVLYAHYKKLDYFSTECTYAPEAFRGTARVLMKNLEKIRSSCVTDIIYSGENLALKEKKKRQQFRKQQTNKGTNKLPLEMEVRSDGTVSLSGFKDGNRCTRCGYLSSNTICKACMLLEGLEKSKARIRLENDGVDGAAKLTKTLETLSF